MKVINYFESDKKEHWLNEISKSDWVGAKFLYELLSDNTFFDAVGNNSKLLLLIDDEKLISFCTYAKKDDIQPTDLTPWIGFVFTYPEYRGHRYFGLLMNEVENLARKDDVSNVYISTNHIGLYEKYGCDYMTKMKDIHGEKSRIYVNIISKEL